MNNSHVLNDPIKMEDERNKFNPSQTKESVQTTEIWEEMHLRQILYGTVFAGSWCNNILHLNFV